MNTVHDVYMAAMKHLIERPKDDEGTPLAISLSPAFYDRIGPEMDEHPAAGRIDPGARYPDKLGGLPIVVDGAQQEDFRLIPRPDRS